MIGRPFFAMDTAEIQAAIPHRPPMLLVDRVTEITDDQIVAEKTFRDDEYFFQKHYPDYPLVPGVILCECAAQAGAILLSKQTQAAGGVPVLTRLNDARFKQMVRPGDTIRSEVKIDEVVSKAFYLTAKVTCNDKMVVRFSFVCTVAESEQK